MFNSTVLDVVVGLSFVFLTASLITSAVSEAISGILKWRSVTLLRGIKDLLNDQQLTGLAAQLYQHALINPRNPGTSQTANDLSDRPLTRLWHAVTGQITGNLSYNAPAYIDPKQFADALIDVLSTGQANINAAAVTHPGPMLPGNAASIGVAIDHVVPAATNPQINGLLQGIARHTGGNLDLMKLEIAAWFDNAMDRVGGVYKRWSQRLNFMIALGLAIALNISAVHVAKALWQQPIDTKIISKVLAATPPTKVDEALKTVDHLQLPIGWAHYERGDVQMERTELLEMTIGWLITAFAVLFGAPFWFDMLQLFVRLKSSGPSPKEKATGAAASA